jgi:sigma-B regulation protein RsbU (phosphoserine phosphatase)
MADITPPYFDSSLGSKTVSLVSELKDQNDRTVGKLKVAIRFDDLVDAVESTGWWKENKAYLIDNAGNILTSNLDSPVKKLGETGSSLERATLNAMIALPFGTVFGQGFPPKEVSGFYKLQEAPWTLVIVTPGAEILSRIVRFSVYYVVAGSAAILIILFMIRFVTSRTVFSIKAVSSAARKVAGGVYDVSLAVKTQDEVGDLIHSFNTMVLQLEDRGRLKYALNLARVVQQNLLPEKAVRFESIDVAGQSIYCDETGGDYYDFLEFPEQGKGKFGVIVGDVSGHGISAALFMATVRALIRSRMIQSDDPSKIITDVNRLLCIDTAQSSNFMTLFFMMLDVANNEVTWVRAGHDSAILYDTAADEFMELGGEGIALGVDEKRSFKEYSLNGLHNGQVILIGTDGIWETENERGERFGKDRLREILRRNSRGSAEKIIQAITDNLVAFRQNATQTDDVTMVVIKAWS